MLIGFQTTCNQIKYIESWGSWYDCKTHKIFNEIHFGTRVCRFFVIRVWCPNLVYGFCSKSYVQESTRMVIAGALQTSRVPRPLCQVAPRIDCGRPATLWLEFRSNFCPWHESYTHLFVKAGSVLLPGCRLDLLCLKDQTVQSSPAPSKFSHSSKICKCIFR